MPSHTCPPRGAPAGEPAVRFEGAVRRYGPLHTVGPLDLAVRPGTCTALTGPNGCGKSTALRMAAGDEPCDEGAVRVLGAPPDQADPAFRRRVAVLDAPAFFPDLTVREHLELTAVGHGLGGRAPARVEEVLDECRLSAHAGLAPDGLSSGLRQMMSIAALLLPPVLDLLLLDEPERHLDHEARRWLADVLRARRDGGACLLLATHHRPLVESLAHEVHDMARPA
ncbi:ATP-binding cassette domain-containing protein [Nocardiopsis sp. LOL_012]|uniref:ATP-binding cassette domain-containing protein n=1 Tax=Nocardiopsis sp. LOL_012 TaxID=3345409 RepID=UPI003A83D825